MKFQRERDGNKPVIEVTEITEKQLRRQLSYKRAGDFTFAILEKNQENFIQVYGGGSGCCLELRNGEENEFLRAHLEEPQVPVKQKTKLGKVFLEPDEFVSISQVTECFVAYLKENEFPRDIYWRDITEELRNSGIKI